MSKNYGETLAYWYLRLNGFFPLVNFVLHKPNEASSGRGSADTDILAVRLPHVIERIGGVPGYITDDKPGDWDSKFRGWGFDLSRKTRETIGLIVEVKSGETSYPDVCRAFSKKRIMYALKRLGMLSLDKLDDVSRKLCNEDTECGRVNRRVDGEIREEILYGGQRIAHPDDDGTLCIGKLLISRDPLESDCWFNFTLDEAFSFITQRLHKYREDKMSDYIYFPDELMQFLIWRERANEPNNLLPPPIRQRQRRYPPRRRARSARRLPHAYHLRG